MNHKRSKNTAPQLSLLTITILLALEGCASMPATTVRATATEPTDVQTVQTEGAQQTSQSTGGGATVAPSRPASTAQLRLILAGDSTVADYTSSRFRPQAGWGQMLQELFDDRLAVVNFARGGASTKTFRDEGLWEACLLAVKPGDYVLIQFAHNDQKPDNEARYVAPGTYEQNLRRMVEEVRARGGEAVLVTPVERRRFGPAGEVANTHKFYPQIMRTVADEMRCPLVDLQEATLAWLGRLGPEGSRAVYNHLQPGQHPNFPNGQADDTHFNEQGARAVAAMVVEGLLAAGVPVGGFLRAR